MEFENRLDEQFGPARLEEAADLAEHAEQCALCRQALEHVRLLSDSLELWREQVPEVDFTAGVVLRYLSQAEAPTSPAVAGPGNHSFSDSAASSRSSSLAVNAGIVARSFPLPVRSSRRVWLAVGSLAALALAAMLVFGLRDDGRRPIPLAQTAKIADQPGDIQTDEIAATQSPEESRGVVPEEIPAPPPHRAIYYDLAQKAQGALGEVSAFVMTGSAGGMASSDPGMEDTEGWIDGLEQQLKPIGRSLDDAFDFLWQAGQSAEGSQS